MSYLHIQLMFQSNTTDTFSRESKRHFKDSNKINSPQMGFICSNKTQQGLKKAQNLGKKALNIKLWITRKTSRGHKNLWQDFPAVTSIFLSFRRSKFIFHTKVIRPVLKIICTSWLTLYCLIRDKLLSSFQLAQKYQDSTLSFLCVK